MNCFSETVLESFRLQTSQESISPVMHSPLFERLAQDALSPEMYSSLFEQLELEAELTRKDGQRRAHVRAWELARQQGVKPISDIKKLQGDFWPEEDSIDDFLSWLRATRREDKDRSIPE